MSSQISALVFFKVRPPFTDTEFIYSQEKFIREVTHGRTAQRGQTVCVKPGYCSEVLLITDEIHPKIFGMVIGVHKSVKQQG